MTPTSQVRPLPSVARRLAHVLARPSRSNRFRTTVRLAVLALCAGSAQAQLTWTALQPDHAPSARYGHATAIDSPGYQPMLFGGTDGQVIFDDLWIWTGDDWQLTGHRGPEGRHDHAYVPYDWLDSGVLLFGGEGAGGTLLDDTWVHRTQGWTPYPVSGPSARAGHAMQPDRWVNGVVLLFGGRTAAGWSDETWRFQNFQWSQVMTRHAPPAREGHVMIQLTDQSYLIQGGHAGGTVFDDAWVFDGGDWTRVDGPGVALSGHAVGWESNRRRDVFFGGQGPGTAHTLERTRTGAWLSHVTVETPTARSEAAFFRYLQPQGPRWDTYLFGGRDANGRALGDTLRLDEVTRASVDTQLGGGCGPGAWGREGGPNLFMMDMPRLGETPQISGMTSISTPLMLFAVGDRLAGPLFGRIGHSSNPTERCGLHIAPATLHIGEVIAQGPSFTQAAFDLDIPFDLALHGRSWFVQAIAANPTSPIGRDFSQVAELHLAE